VSRPGWTLSVNLQASREECGQTSGVKAIDGSINLRSSAVCTEALHRTLKV